MISLIEKQDFFSGTGEGGRPVFFDKPSPRSVVPGRSEAAAILIIEDDDTIRETLADILEYEGYTVSTAPNGSEALTYLQTNPAPHLILLDLMMPEMSGWEMRSQQLQEPKLAAIPVVILSGVHDLRQQATTLASAGYLPKPLDVNRLLATVRRYCG